MRKKEGEWVDSMGEPSKLETIKTLVEESKIDEAKDTLSSLQVSDFADKEHVKILRDIFINTNSTALKELIKNKINKIADNGKEWWRRS